MLSASEAPPQMGKHNQRGSASLVTASPCPTSGGAASGGAAKPRAAIVGASGRLGGVMRAAMSRRWAVYGLTRADLDVTNHDAVMRVIAEIAPSVIVNCSAYTQVDAAEDHAADAFAVNAFGVDSLARAASAANAVLVHFSTDFVFDGAIDRPYAETDVPQPRGVYGQSKLVGEWLAAQPPRHYILRVASLFGGTTTSSIDRLIAQVRDGDRAPAFVDRTVTPSLVDDVAAATMHLLDREASSGVYHVVSSDATTWYELAVKVAALMGQTKDAVTPVKVADVKLRAARPQFAALSSRKLAGAGFVMPTWQSMLKAYLPRVMPSRQV